MEEMNATKRNPFIDLESDRSNHNMTTENSPFNTCIEENEIKLNRL